jgi:hypothetical protein
MALQQGLNPYIGTIGNLNFCIRNGKYEVRRKPHIERERIMKDHVFKRTKECAEGYAKAVELAREFYRFEMPKEKKVFGCFGRLCGQVNILLRTGKSKEEVKDVLRPQYLEGR